MNVGKPSDSHEESPHHFPSDEWSDPQWVGLHPVTLGQLKPGEIVGRCKVVRELGTGGMGVVYLATHMTLQIDVALKILSPALVKERAEMAKRFVREAQLAARVRHPNVVSVMDADFDQASGLYYIVFEYVPGGSLADRLRHGRLSETETIHIILDIAQALVVAAEHNIVHRDIKPDNIMLDSKGTAKLADLGLAKQAFAGVSCQLTQGGASVGTPSYMSPEQIRDAQNADAQDDIYSLGATLFECLTGAPPFAAANPYNAVGQILFSPTPDPRAMRSDVSHELSAICQRMMAKKKEDRYPDAATLVEDLQTLQSKGSLAHFLPGWKKKGQPAEPRNPKQEWFYNEIVNPPRKTRLIDVFLYLIILLVTIWVLRAILLPEDAHRTAQATPDNAALSENPLPNTGATDTASTEMQAVRALPVEPQPGETTHLTASTSIPTNATTSSLATQIQPTPIALPPPEPIPGEEPTTTEETVPAQPALSAFQAKAQAEQMIAESIRGNVMQISGTRRPGNPTPGTWRFLYWDPDADQHVRAVTVNGNTASPAKEGFVELGKLRVVSYKKSEIIAPNRLLIDSTKALEIIQSLPELKDTPITSAAFYLDKAKGANMPPIWRITLFTKRNNDEAQLGEVRISAETGLILEFGVKLNRIQQPAP
jgi:serine/threonine protein kinase